MHSLSTYLGHVHPADTPPTQLITGEIDEEQYAVQGRRPAHARVESRDIDTMAIATTVVPNPATSTRPIGSPSRSVPATSPTRGTARNPMAVSYTHLTLPTNREV